jgi:uncharacterized protein
MLQLRPTCEHCDKPLPPNATDAMICSYECTFCATCVETVLSNVCPNCGGGFHPRPIRPARDWRGGNTVASDPPSAKIVFKPVDPASHALFAAAIRVIPPQER